MAPQAKVIVIGPTPRWLSPLPALYRNALMFNHGILAMRSSQHLDPNIVGLDNLMQTALEKSGIDYLSPQKELCDASGCITRFSEDLHCPSFVDEEHVSKKTAEFLIEKFAPEILPSSQLQSNQAPKAIDAL